MTNTKRLTAILIAVFMLVQLLAGTAIAADSGYGKTVAASFSGFSPRTMTEGETLRYGIDVSEHNGTIAWEQVAASGIDFAFIRVGCRTYGGGILKEDASWKENLSGAMAAGLDVGVYIYSQAISEQEAREEAEFVLSLIGGYELTLPVVIDYEYANNVYGTEIGRLYNARLGDSTRTAICNAFCRVVKEAGYDACIYAAKSMLQSDLNADELEGTVWLSHTASSTGYSGDYDFWQCSFRGYINGISGKVDINYWFDDGSFGVGSALPFSDVTRADWCYRAVATCYKNGIIIGNDDGTYEPERLITRGELVTMLYRVAGSPQVDMNGSDAKPAAVWAVRNELLPGKYSDMLTDDPVTRQEMISMLYHLSGDPEASVPLNAFSDTDEIDDNYYDAFYWAVATQILRGDGDTLCPQEQVCRDAAAVLLMRYIQHMGY